MGRRRRVKRVQRRLGHLFLKVRSVRNIQVSDASPVHSETTTWSLDDFTAGGEIGQAAGLFQEYKINAARVQFFPTRNTSGLEGASFVQTLPTVGSIYQSSWKAGQVYFAVDYDGGTPWSAAADGLQYGNLKLTTSIQRFDRLIRPKFKSVIMNDAGSPANVAAGFRNGWLSTDTVGQTVRYAGFKMLIDELKDVTDPGTLNDLVVGRIVTTLYVAFRRRR